ncbi:methyltransferase domain-containing protein [Terasakiella sp. A23]|uniref:methyltransferase domain-containing protein n=1 Tax=Terasakiella sp. FCG-A23 TaxID=3080561 RepID=UPI002952FFDF|nr:methyltransferase domain-containing protein [Terasakiella sp. A23]MDV7338722.1 methyltransferase domain-containing protein [Terasakiella sp. A23]
MNKSYIKHSFGNAAQTYDQQAPVQKWTAGFLADYVRDLNLGVDIDCLEIGCGTGFLTQEMVDLFPKAKWMITDLSDQMIATCRDRIGDGVTYQQMDGEFPNIEGKFDLIVTSLAVQWFSDLEAGLGRLAGLLKPGGHLVFTTLGKDSFCEWRDLLVKEGQPVGLHDYPDLNTILSYQFNDCAAVMQSHAKKQNYENGLAFLRALKLIGAQAPRKGYSPMGPAALKKVLAKLEDKTDCSMTYEILIGDVHKGMNI